MKNRDGQCRSSNAGTDSAGLAMQGRTCCTSVLSTDGHAAHRCCRRTDRHAAQWGDGRTCRTVGRRTDMPHSVGLTAGHAAQCRTDGRTDMHIGVDGRTCTSVLTDGHAAQCSREDMPHSVAGRTCRTVRGSHSAQRCLSRTVRGGHSAQRCFSSHGERRPLCAEYSLPTVRGGHSAQSTLSSLSRRDTLGVYTLPTTLVVHIPAVCLPPTMPSREPGTVPAVYTLCTSPVHADGLLPTNGLSDTPLPARLRGRNSCTASSDLRRKPA